MAPQTCLKTFWHPLGRQFGGHTLEEAGGSHWMPQWLHFTTRLISLSANVGVLAYASAIGLWTLILATALWSPILLMLTAASALHARRRSGYRLLANVALPLYQTLVSLTVFLLPMFTYLSARNAALWPEAAFIGSTFLLVLVDQFLMGARVRFRVQVLWMPMLADLAFFGFLVVVLTAAVAASSLGKAVGYASVAGVAIAAAFYALLWSVASTLLVVVGTRFTDCCFPPMLDCPQHMGAELA